MQYDVGHDTFEENKEGTEATEEVEEAVFIDANEFEQLAEQVEALGNAVTRIMEIVKQHDGVLVSLSKSMKDMQDNLNRSVKEMKETVEDVRRPKIIY